MKSPTPGPGTARRHPKLFGLVLLSALGMMMSGCRVVEETAKIPAKAVTAVVPGAKSSQLDPAALQTDLQRFADDFIGRTIPALDEYALAVGTSKARDQSLKWKVSVGSAAIQIASGPNPTANLLDFLTLTTLSRTALEDWTKSEDGKALQLWLDTSRALEAEAWRIAESVFTPSQQQELRDTIAKWWKSNAGTSSTFFARPQEFATLIRQTGKKSEHSDSVFALVGLDATAGLDPAVREVTRTRLFAERAMYVAQRMPFLLGWHIEMLTVQLLQDPQVSTTLTQVGRVADSAERLSRAAESLTETAAQLPDRVSAERKAILDALEAEAGKLRELSAEIGRTLGAGEKMSTSLNTSLVTFDALMKRFGVGEPSTAPPDTNKPPFDILDYARTAEQITAMAQQLDVLLKQAGTTLDSPALDKKLADLSTVSTQAKTDAKSVLNHAFLLAAGLLVLALIFALVYKRLPARASGSPDL